MIIIEFTLHSLRLLTHVRSSRPGVFFPICLEIYSFMIPIFSIYCALLAVLSIILPPSSAGADLDYAYALLAVVGACMTSLARVFPAVITVVFPRSGVLLCPGPRGWAFALGGSGWGPDTTKKMMIQWRLAHQDLLKKVIGQ